MAAGEFYTALLRSDGKVVTSGVSVTVPDLPEGVVYTGIAGGEMNTVLLRSDGTAVEVTTLASEDLDVPELAAGVSYTQAAAGGSHTVLLSAVDTAPVASDDAVAAVEDTPLVITAISLLENDSDPEGRMLTITAVWGAAHGTTALGANASITYTPNANYFGTDTFQYSSSDGTLGDAATVTVNIAAVDDAPVINSVTSAPGIGNSWTVTVDAIDGDGVVLDVQADNPIFSVTSFGGQPGKYIVALADEDPNSFLHSVPGSRSESPSPPVSARMRRPTARRSAPSTTRSHQASSKAGVSSRSELSTLVRQFNGV